MGLKRRSGLGLCAPVVVGGTPPRPTLKPKVTYHAKTGRMYLFGGDKPADEVRAEYKLCDRPIEQRNALYYLATSIESDRMSWCGPFASDTAEPFLRNIPSGAIPRSEHVWIPAANPDFLMAQGGSYMACGVSYMDQGGMADWLAFDTEANQWTELQPPIADDHSEWAVPKNVHRLPVLSGHAGALDSRTGRILLLMAFGEEFEIPAFDPKQGLPGFVFFSEGEPAKWDFQALETTGEGPSYRAWYSMTITGRRLIVFGGAHQAFEQGKWQVMYPDDVCTLDLDTMHWSKLETLGATPEGRMHHGAIALDENRLLILGGERGFGETSRGLTDAHVLDVSSATWTRLTESLSTPRHATWVGCGPPGAVRVFALGGDSETFSVFEFHAEYSV